MMMALLASAAGCIRSETMVGEEVAQKIDFYSSLKILVTKDGTGIYRVYGAAIDREDGGEELFRTNSRDGVALDWIDKDNLKLTIPCGKVITFKNVFDINDADGDLKRRIRVNLDAEGPVTCL
jgi:hypothetical protein